MKQKTCAKDINEVLKNYLYFSVEKYPQSFFSVGQTSTNTF